MKIKACCGSLLLSIMTLMPLLASAAIIEGFVGHSATQIAPGMSVKLLDGNTGSVVDIDDTNFFGKYKFTKVVPGYYLLQVGETKRELMIKEANEKKRLDIDLSVKGGAMDYSKAGREPVAPAPSSKGRTTAPAKSQGQPKPKPQAQTAPAGANNASLQQQIAGLWWGYSGSTERSIGLCPDGSYTDSAESSYSGDPYGTGGTWGAASQRGGQGSWTIQGDTQSGVIHVRYQNGGTTQLNFNQIGDPGCLNVNGNTLCRKSASCR